MGTTSPELEDLMSQLALLDNERSAIERSERRKVEIPAEEEKLQQAIRTEEKRVATEHATRWQQIADIKKKISVQIGPAWDTILDLTAKCDAINTDAQEWARLESTVFARRLPGMLERSAAHAGLNRFLKFPGWHGERAPFPELAGRFFEVSETKSNPNEETET